MSLRWPEAITRYQGCGRVPAAFFIFGVSLVSVTTRNEMADDFGDGPGTGIRQTSPITSRSPSGPSGIRRSQMDETDLFCKHPDVFPDATGRSPDTGQARKKVFWRGGGEGRRSFCPPKGPLPRPQENTGADGSVAVLPLFCRDKKRGEHRCSPQR